MKLKRVRVENYKCIEDSDLFEVDQVTCLMGKNEAGKTALLEALYKLNPVEADKADFNELEFPRRHVTTYRQREAQQPANVLTTVWELEPSDIEYLDELLGSGVVANQEITITKGYDNRQLWTVQINEPTLVANLINSAKFNASEKAPLQSQESVKALTEKIEELDTPTEKQTALLNQLRQRFPKQLVSQFVYESLAKDRLPHFLYFGDYYKLPGRVALTDLKQRAGVPEHLSFGDKIFSALLDMTSSSLEDVEGIGESEKLIMELEAIQNHLTDEIFEFWTQNKHLDVKFRFDHARPQDPPPFNQGYIFSTRIHNQRHRVTVNFEERSTGFTWFFSFLIWFSQVKKNYSENLILLLDEPGLSLHGKAQKDLVRYINERLRPKQQVIYTAHSPFMIDVEHIFSLRTVEDVVEHKENGETVERILGTKVGQRILSRDEDTLFPLQGIVGFDIAQTMFVGPYVVVVEGPTEYALFHWFSRQLVVLDREGLDIRWAVCPAESASKVSSFVTLFHGRSLKIATLMDYHKGQKGLVDRLEESNLLEPGHLLKTTTYASQDDADIEDVVGREMYIQLVNGALRLPKSLAMPEEKPDDADIRVVKEAEALCMLLPPGFEEFYHYLPVQYLMGLSDDEAVNLPGLDDALNRFEELFRDLNNLI